MLDPKCARDVHDRRFQQVGELGSHLGAKVGSFFVQDAIKTRPERSGAEELGSGGGGGVSTGTGSVGINPTRVGL